MYVAYSLPYNKDVSDEASLPVVIRFLSDLSVWNVINKNPKLISAWETEEEPGGAVDSIEVYSNCRRLDSWLGFFYRPNRESEVSLNWVY